MIETVHGPQLVEAVRAHARLGRRRVAERFRARAHERFSAVGAPTALRRLERALG